VHLQDCPEAIDRRTLLAKGGAALAALLVSGCSRSEPRGFSADGLDRLRSGLQRHLEPGFAPGLVGLVARGDEAEAFVLGKMAFDRGADMRRDSIFRIASMTKAITAAAVMMLVDDGKLRLDEPVDRLLPELANRRVLRSIDADVEDTVPAKRPLTVDDLLTFRCGLGMVLAPPDRYPIQNAIAALGVNGVGFGPPDPAMPLDGDAWMRKIGSLPLFAQPGEEWLYTAGSNIQGVLIARASGRPLSRFFEERIFGPLGMKDTAFFVPISKIDRLVHAYRPQHGTLVVSDEPATGKWSRPPAFEQGDAGLVSTGDDYLAFARMLLADGRYRGQTVLTPASANVMKTNHLTASQRAGAEEILGRGRGWGYGMSVVTDTIQGQPTAGSFGWIGGFGSSWISDPSKDLTMILLTQREFVSASGDPIHQQFQGDAYRALR
jgi:CubicO group peptidase (beta-lactamase class C family)